ncbi:hypothetical protein GGR50DRAFT_706918 [Xylaria sp. CBS 124048]|nr:hypothetical protein GGR50DRAFT_706918 [Xylaria sp. CBS 124048]
MSQTSVVDREHSPGLPAASRTRRLGESSWSAGVALVSATIAYYLTSQQCELASELACWLWLPLLFGIGRLRLSVGKRNGLLLSVNAPSESGGNGTGKTSSLSLWIIAAGLVTCSAFKAERGIVIPLLPALTPLLAIVRRYWRPDGSPPIIPHASFFSPYFNNILGLSLAAVFAIVTLSEWEPLVYGISIIPVVSLFVAYMLLTPRAGQNTWFRTVNFSTTVGSLSLRVVFLLVIILGRQTYLQGFPDINPLEAVIVGLAKASTWYFTSHLTHSSWLAASLGGTFGLLASRNPFSQQTDTHALMNVIASLITLAQTMYFLPRSAKSRWTFWVVSLLPVQPYLANQVAIKVAQSLAVVHTEKHPVEVLITKANNHFDSLMQNQSTTYEAAHAEYRRRYGFEPPAGFEAWYAFARSHQSPIIDEFDIISDGILPFLRLSGTEVLEIMSRIYPESGHEVWTCVMSGFPAKTQCGYRDRENDPNNAQFFDKITERLPVHLNLTFLLNHLDEPAVIIPPAVERPSNIRISNLADQRAYETLTKFCPFRQSRGRRQQESPVETYGLPFVTDRESDMDVCAHTEYGEMHGLLLAPESLRLIEGPVPVLSSGALNVFGDILYPSTAYTEEERFRYHSTDDVEWEAKKNNLYWAGSTTGGHNSETSWRNMQRQRFVSLAQNLNLTPSGTRTYSYLQEKRGDSEITRTTSSFLNSRLYDVAFASILQCDAKACEAQRKYFKPKPWASGNQPFRSRLVFDVDGNGISGRYYKLLASKSAPLKQTLFREWHDDRLMPWVHYIPVSQGMDELPELVFYLTSTPSGRERAREIAEQGRKWFGRAFREIDMTIYMYRLFLELARLQDPERPAWNMAVE